MNSSPREEGHSARMRYKSLLRRTGGRERPRRRGNERKRRQREEGISESRMNSLKKEIMTLNRRGRRQVKHREAKLETSMRAIGSKPQGQMLVLTLRTRTILKAIWTGQATMTTTTTMKKFPPTKTRMQKVKAAQIRRS